MGGRGGGVVLTCVKDNSTDKKEQYKDIGLRGFDYKLFEEEEGWGGGSRGIRRVSLFEAYNSVVARVLGQADGKMNEAVGMNKPLDMSGGKKRLKKYWPGRSYIFMNVLQYFLVVYH